MSFSIFHIKIRFLCVFVPLWLILNESNYGYNIGRASQLEYEPDPVGEYESGKAGAFTAAWNGVSFPAAPERSAGKAGYCAAEI